MKTDATATEIPQLEWTEKVAAQWWSDLRVLNPWADRHIDELLAHYEQNPWSNLDFAASEKPEVSNAAQHAETTRRYVTVAKWAQGPKIWNI